MLFCLHGHIKNTHVSLLCGCQYGVRQGVSSRLPGGRFHLHHGAIPHGVPARLNPKQKTPTVAPCGATCGPRCLGDAHGYPHPKRSGTEASIGRSPQGRNPGRHAERRGKNASGLFAYGQRVYWIKTPSPQRHHPRSRLESGCDEGRSKKVLG